MSALVDRAIAAAGLDGWLARRLSGSAHTEDCDAIDGICRELDLLVLGAIADRVRAHDRGGAVRIHIDRPPAERHHDARSTVRILGHLQAGGAESGHALMRRVAHERLSGFCRAPHLAFKKVEQCDLPFQGFVEVKTVYANHPLRPTKCVETVWRKS